MTPRILIATALSSVLCRVVALKVESNSPLTQPMFNSIHQQSLPVYPLPVASKIFPVPTASRCIVILCVQFMLAYTALALCRTFHELTGSGKGRLEAALKAAAQTLTYGPMLCVLFIAYNMRVEYLSHGQGEPQAWVQACMYALTLAVLASALLTLVIQLITGKPLPPKLSAVDLEMAEEEQAQAYSPSYFYVLTTMRYVVLFFLYAGLAGVLLGICTYLPPGVQKLSDVEAPAPAVMCTMILAVVFFSTQLIIAACRTYIELCRVDFPQIVGMMNTASTIMEFAPMLAALFLAARMRALQHGSQPNEWVHACMYLTTGAMCVTSLLAILVPMTLGGFLKVNPWTHEVVVEVPSPTLGYIFLGLRYVCMMCFYGGALGVILSIFFFEAPDPAETLPVSPALQCVVNLTCQFFFIYFLMTVMLTVSELTGGSIPMEQWSLFSAVESARSTLAFAPMLSIIFIATRMYALTITDNKGSPPAWVQDAMCMATWSLQISGLMCLGSGLLLDKVETDEDGNVVNKFTNWYVGVVVVAIRYAAMLLLYSGMMMVVFGLFTMTPETAKGRGLVPLIVEAVTAASNAANPMQP